MRTHTAILFAAMLFVSGFTITNAQQTINASGGEGNGSGGTVSYSVGQMTYRSTKGTSGSVSEGVQHAYEISDVSGVEGSISVNLELSVFPNPATDDLILSINSVDGNEFSYQLYDVNGRLLESKKILGEQVSIAMKHLSASTYFLKVLDRETSIKTFQIIKN